MPVLFFLGALLVNGPLWGQSALDVQLCRQSAESVRIAACTRLLESVQVRTGQLPTNALAVLYLNRGTAYSKSKQPSLAVRDYDIALSLDPYLTDAYYNRGKDYSDLGLQEQAIADLSTALRLQPSTFGAWGFNDRGKAYALHSRFEDARRDFETALMLDPSNDAIRRNLRYLVSLADAPPPNENSYDTVLDKIIKTANELCTIPQSGSRSQVEVSGEVNFGLRLLNKIIELFGIKAGVTYQTEQWHGPLQEQISSLIVSSHQCKTEIVKLLKEVYIS